MWRKRRRPTPHFKIPSPFNPIQGENANLRQDGISPFCAMMQVAAEDTYADYVICRGFDTRILRFVDYAVGDADKPGISVAKPFGKRRTGTYEIGQVYPALLPTQGNADFTDFRNVTFVPPSPVAVNWRVGQNPGKVTGGGQDGGQPEALTDTIEILYDHNGKVVNWMLMDSGSGAGTIEFTIDSVATAVTGPYTGLEVATVTITTAPCGRPDLIGTTVDVVDHSGCVFDSPDLTGVWGWATERIAPSLEEGAAPGDMSPCHWAADDRCRTRGGGMLQGTLSALVAGVATITVAVAPCDRPELLGSQVEVTDHSGCVFDKTEAQLMGVWVWASEGVVSITGDCLWCADDRCCVAADSQVVVDGGTP